MATSHKRLAKKPLFYYLRRGLALTLAHWRTHGWNATKARIKYQLWPPKSHREAQRLIGLRDHTAIFSHYYHGNSWGNIESSSGGGSTLASTEKIRRHLPLIFEQFNIKRVVDAPCGDFYWMRLVPFGDDMSYVGLDVVPELIAKNREAYASDLRQFVVRNITRDSFPPGDILICRDCLPHFSYEDIYLALRNFAASDVKFLLTTTFAGLQENYDIDTGQFRALDLTAEPFCLPKDVLYQFDDYAEPHPHHTMALWSRAQVAAALH